MFVTDYTDLIKKRGVYLALLLLAMGVGFVGARHAYQRPSAADAKLQPSATVPTRPLFQTVDLLPDRAEPNTVLIPVGGVVQFNSKDGKTHNIAEGQGDDYDRNHGHTDPGTGVESGAFGADEGYKVTFKQAGTYFFHDHLNPALAISVIAY